MQSFDPELVLHRPLMANLATVDQAGNPRNAPVWFIWEQGTLWMLGTKRGSTVRQLSYNPNCAVEIVHFDNDTGILLHCGLRGKATVEGNDPTLFRRLLSKYLGHESSWNEWFIKNLARIEDPDGRMIRLNPDSIFTNNVSYFKTGPDVITEFDLL